jgi:hypothetical protein
MTSFKSFLGTGDLTIVGWLTVILYFSTVISCWITARKLRLAEKDIEDAKELRGWQWITATFLALGVCRLLNFQAALTETGRVVAKFQGWYGQRWSVQFAFLAVLAVACLIAAVMLGRWVRKASVATWLALTGSTVLTGYVVARVVSFHHLDRLIDAKFLGIRFNWIFELGGIGVVLAASYWRRSNIGKSRFVSLSR